MGYDGSKFRIYAQIFLVFTLTGLWHGAQWNYVLWGMYYGVFLVIESMGLRSIVERTWRPFQHTYLLLIVFMGMVFFRSNSFSEMICYYQKMFNFEHLYISPLLWEKCVTSEFSIAFMASILLSFPIYPRFRDQCSLWMRNSSIFIYTLSNFLSMIMLFALLFLSMVKVSASTHNPFIYFRF
jgi:alginate O-acetyltransferase complex protein AlgI